MKIRLRLRLFLKWLGLAVCLLIAFAFAVSTRRAANWTSSNLERQVVLMHGQVGYGWRPDGWRLEDDPYAGSPGWIIAEYGGRPRLGWWITRSANRAWAGISFPLWMPFLLLSAPTAVLWYWDRRLTREAIEKWKVRLCPHQPKKMRVWLVVVCSLIHGIAAFPCLVVFCRVSEFFLVPSHGTSWPGAGGQNPAQAVIDGIFTWAGPCLFFGTPIWGAIWAWLYVRLLNRFFRRVRPHCCVNCGYDLTGNVSGVCSECGKAVPAESKDRRPNSVARPPVC